MRFEARIPAGDVALSADVTLPPRALGSVVFAHGSGSSRRSPRNRYVARVLHEAGFVSVLVDLLTPEEDEEDVTTRQHRFDVPLLAGRVRCVVEWVRDTQDLSGLPVSLFGASTGAAAALVAAADAPGSVRAVVSRGGRPDLAGDALKAVRADTLLLVGEDDERVLELNEDAHRALTCTKELVVVPGAGHLFEEPGTLEAVAGHTLEWLLVHAAER